MQTEPLILTLLLDENSHHYFTGLRNRHFPKYCNFLEAHVTLFHKLPQDKPIIAETLKEICKRNNMLLEVTGLTNMGNGVAFEIRSPELVKLHKTLQQKFSRFLISKDRQKLWPHITVQNKVTAFKASQTLALLQKDFKPFSAEGVGIGAWIYNEGPWEEREEFLFKP